MATIHKSWEAMRAAAPPREEECLYEIVAGQWVKMPPMSVNAARIGSRLTYRIETFARRQGLGEAVALVLFHFPARLNVCRRPAVAFVSHKRCPKGQPQDRRDNAWDVIPNLAAEVISANDSAE